MVYLLGYTRPVIEVRQTDAHDTWFRRLRDRQARARILIRIHRLSPGNPGDVRLAGGDKATQRHDIERARGLAQDLAKGEDR